MYVCLWPVTHPDLGCDTMLRKYIPGPSHILEALPIELEEDLSFEVQSVFIVDREMKQLRNKVILMVKVLWRSHEIEEMIWETEAVIRSNYSYLFDA